MFRLQPELNLVTY
uniref:Uncharacterized protein n=1 Tax=Arundo donax TaxID=35708 RepID=A0A0A9F224_ARUDO